MVGEHFHLRDLLRQAKAHPAVELSGIFDPDPQRLKDFGEAAGLPESLRFGDYRQCLEKCRPDFAILCAATARHAEWVERIAPHGVHLIVEKPFAASVAQADRMIAAVRKNRVRLAINWPMRWSPPMVTAHRLLVEGVIGKLQEVHYYGGNRGPVRRASGEVETRRAVKARSWFYQKRSGGGSLLDYLGYGTTLGTWYHDGAKPEEVMCLAKMARGFDVDDHSITVARYACGLSKFETRWGTLTDPWIQQHHPRSGFILKGERGNLAANTGESLIHVQTEARPKGFTVAADRLKFPFTNAIEYFIHCLETGTAIAGPLAPAIARIGQQIVDSAQLSARLKRAVPLVGE